MILKLIRCAAHVVSSPHHHLPERIRLVNAFQGLQSYLRQAATVTTTTTSSTTATGVVVTRPSSYGRSSTLNRLDKHHHHRRQSSARAPLASLLLLFPFFKRKNKDDDNNDEDRRESRLSTNVDDTLKEHPSRLRREGGSSVVFGGSSENPEQKNVIVTDRESDHHHRKKTNPLPLPEETNLTLNYLVRNAASIAGEDAGNLLALALQKLIDAQKQLKSDLGRLKTLIEGLSVAEEKSLPDVYTQLWDAVTAQRLHVSAARDRLLDCQVLLQLSVNVASAAADVAFVADAEFIASSLNDKLNKVELYKRQSEESLASTELLLAAAEAKLINSTPVDGDEVDDVDNDVNLERPADVD